MPVVQSVTLRPCPARRAAREVGTGRVNLNGERQRAKPQEEPRKARTSPVLLLQVLRLAGSSILLSSPFKTSEAAPQHC